MFTEQKIQEMIEEENLRWAEQEKEIQRQYDRLAGLHSGRISAYNDMLETIRKAEQDTEQR